MLCYILIQFITAFVMAEIHSRHTIENIKAKKGNSPDDFKKLTQKKGFQKGGELVKTVKATEITNWLTVEFDIGHGLARAIFATLKVKKD
jgi:hypothetical protein